MTYHDLSECTLTSNERYIEAEEIISMLEAEKDIDDFNENEQNMINNVQHYQACSIKQLFWLRDIKDKYL